MTLIIACKCKDGIVIASDSQVTMRSAAGPIKKKTFDKFVHESGRAICEIGFWFFDPRGAAAIDESKIVCPVLVIAGSEDRLAPSSVVR